MLLVCTLTVWLATGHASGAEASNWIAIAAMALMAVGAMRAGWYGAVSSRPGWRLLAAVPVFWMGAQGLYIYMASSQNYDHRLMDLSNVLFMAGTPCLIMAVLYLFGQGQSSFALYRRLVDTGIVVSSLLLLSYLFILEPWASQPSANPVETAFSYVYPIGDAIVLGLILTFFPRMSRELRAALWPLAAGLGFNVVADTAFAYSLARGAYSPEDWFNISWVVGEVLVGYAGIRAASWAQAPNAPAPVLPTYGTTTVAVPVVAAVLALWRFEQHGLASLVPVYIGAVMFLGLILRQVLHAGEMRLAAQNLRVRLEKEEQLLRATNEAAGHRAELERVARISEFKTQLLNAASHELNTPIGALRLQLHLLKGQLQDSMSKETQEAMRLLDRNVDRLGALITDTLDVARIQSGRLAVLPVRTNVAEVANDLVATFRPLYREKGGRIEGGV